MNSSPFQFENQDTKIKIKNNRNEFINGKINSKKYCDNILDILSVSNIVSNKSKMSTRDYIPKVIGSNTKLCSDKIYSLYQYYASMINDSLNQIRHNKTAYLYSEEQIKDILKYEPNINITYEDGAFCISL